MKRALVLLAAVAVFGAPASAQDGSGFQQTQGRSSYGGSGSAYGNSWRSDEAQTGSAPAGRQPAQQDQGTPVPAGGRSGKQAKRARKIDDPRKTDDGENGVSDARAEASGEREAAPARVDLATARENFAALVDNYVSKHSAKGCWSYVEKKGAKARHLTDPAVDEDSLRQVRAGRFAARVTLRVEGSKKKLPLEFEADLSGADWRSVAVRPVSSRR